MSGNLVVKSFLQERTHLGLNTFINSEGNTHSGLPNMPSEHPLQLHCVLCRGTARRLCT